MGFNISEFKGELAFGGQRPTLFEVQLTFPAAIGQGAGKKLSFTAQGTELPESTVGIISVGYKGRMLPYAGDRQFAPWAINVINDEDWVVRNAFETWSNMVNARERNIRQTATSAPSFYKASGIVKQYSRVNDQIPTRYYKFNDLWPTTIGGIGLSWDQQNSIETFQVRFEYNWWDVAGPSVAGNFSNS